MLDSSISSSSIYLDEHGILRTTDFFEHLTLAKHIVLYILYRCRNGDGAETSTSMESRPPECGDAVWKDKILQTVTTKEHIRSKA